MEKERVPEQPSKGVSPEPKYGSKEDKREPSKEEEPRPFGILVVDDDPEVLEMVRRAFELVTEEREKQKETLGRIELQTTTNPAEALRMIESDNPPDIIFTDLIFEGRNEEIHERYLEYVNEVERLANVVSNMIQGNEIKTIYIGEASGHDLFGEIEGYYATIALPMVRSMRSGKADLEHVYRALFRGKKLEATRNNPEERRKLVEKEIKDAEDSLRRQEEYLRAEEQRCQQEGRDPNTDETVREYRRYAEYLRREIDGLRRGFEIIEKMERGEEIDVKEEFPYGALIFQEAMKRRIDAKIVTDLDRHAVRSISKFTGKPVWEIGILILPLVEQGFIKKGSWFCPIIQGAPRLLCGNYRVHKRPTDYPFNPVTEERSIDSWKRIIDQSIRDVEGERKREE
jgi:CheY-like chemotaxis protein